MDKEIKWREGVIRDLEGISRARLHSKFEQKWNSGDLGFNNLSSSILDLAQRVKTDAFKLKNEEPFTRHIHIFAGIPGSGKSYIENIIETKMFEYIDILGFSPEKLIGKVTWEDSEKKMRQTATDLDIPVSNPQEPFKEWELLWANEEFEMGIFNCTWKKLLTLVEAPLAPEIRLDKKWWGRCLGARSAYKLVHGTGPFKLLPGYDVSVNALVGNHFIRDYSVRLRHHYKNSHSADEAWEAALVFGDKNLFKKVEWDQLTIQEQRDWSQLWEKKLKYEGASQKQMLLIGEKLKEVVNMLAGRGRLPFLFNNTDRELFEAELLYLTLVQETNEDFVGEFDQIDSINLPSRWVFIGFNHPNGEIIPDLDRYNKFNGEADRVNISK